MPLKLFGEVFTDDEAQITAIGDDEQRISFTPDNNGDKTELQRIKADLLGAHLACINAKNQDPGLVAYRNWGRALDCAKAYLYRHYPAPVAHAHLLSCGVFISSTDHTKTAIRTPDGSYQIGSECFTTPEEAIEALNN